MSPEEIIQQEIDELVKAHPVVLFMKGNPQMPQCGFSAKVVGILDDLLDAYETVDVLSRPEIREGVKEYSSWPTVPQLYVGGEFVGGCDIITEMAGAGELHTALGVEFADVCEPTITITAAAAEVLLNAPRPEGSGIRLRISKSFQYEINFDSAGKFDFVIESNGVTLAIDRMSAARADGMQLDYADQGDQSGFRVANPNEAASQ